MRGVHRQPAEGVVRRRRDAPTTTSASTTCPASPATTAPTRPSSTQMDGTCTGYFVMGENPAVGSANAQDAAARHGQPRLAGGARLLADRERDVVEGRARDRDRRAAHRGHRHRGVLPARGRAHREGRQLHEHAAPAAVAPQGGRAGGRRPQRAVVHVPPRPAHPREARRRRPIRWTDRCSTSRGTTRPRGRSTSPTPRRCCAEINGWDADGRAAVGLHGAGGRRLDRVRLLDLLRRVRRRRQPGGAGASPAASRAGSRRSGAGRGRRTAASSTTGRRPIPTASPWSERKAYVWWDAGRGEVDGPRRSRLQGRQAARLTCPPADADGPGRARRSRPVHHAGRRQGVAVRAGGLTDGPLPTHYEPQESPFANPLYGQHAQPARQLIGAGRRPQPVPPERRRAGADVFPYVRDDLPADRAPHRRRHVAVAAVPVRAAAGDVLRGLAGAGGRTRARAPRLGDDRDGAQRDRGAGARDRPAAEPRRAAAGASTRSACRTTGGRTATRPATRPTSSRTSRSTRTCTSRRSRPSRATCGPDGDHVAPTGSRSSRSTGGGPGSPKPPDGSREMP